MIRRDFIKQSMATAVLVAGGQLLPLGRLLAKDGPGSFSTEFYIPPILQKSGTGSARPAYVFDARKEHHEFFPGISTNTLGYNGSFLGPTIRVRDGEEVEFKIKNDLDQVTTVHWHGLHVPARWDGGPHQVIKPGEVWKPRFTINQQAATLWYHPHAMGLTGEHVYRGLAGMFIIDDDVSENLPLPRNYGEDDFPLILQDRRFYEDGNFAYVRSMHDVIHGVLGNYLLVNGALQPTLSVPRGVVRFRVLNGSNSSIYRYRLAGEQQFYVIGTDGGLLTRPVAVSEQILSAGERAEMLLDLTNKTPGTRLRLIVDQYGGTSHEAMEIVVGETLAKQTSIPNYLREQQNPDESQVTNTRYFAMETMSGMGRGMMGGNRLTINGRKMDMERIDVTIPLGSTEIWELRNTSASMMQLPHSMHLHDVQFRILDRNGQPPAPVESGRKDTVLLWPNDKVRIISKFDDYTGVYMYHCHMLEHEDDGMMGQFEVVAARPKSPKYST